MSDLGKQLSTQGLRLDDQVIAEYLQENPDFFERYPELLADMQVRHHRQGAVSLVERQQQVLRDKIHNLEEEITALMANAHRNERLFKSYSALYVEVLACKNLNELEQCLKQAFLHELGLSQFSLKLFVPTSQAHLAFDADTHKQMLAKRLTQAPVYFGRLPAEELQRLFNDKQRTQAVESVALLLLADDTKYGLVALGSDDASHFEPNMDSLLISQLQALLSWVIPSLVE